jgi:hypothetical protein
MLVGNSTHIGHKILFCTHPWSEETLKAEIARQAIVVGPTLLMIQSATCYFPHCKMYYTHEANINLSNTVAIRITFTELTIVW